MVRDDEIIALAKQGDGEAWRHLYRLHASRLAALMRVMSTGDNAVEPEDLAAHAWLTAADRIKSFTGDSDAFGGWLYAIARNQGLHSRRKAGHTAAPVSVGGNIELAADFDGALAEDAAAETERIDWIRHVLEDLPPKQREVVACLDVVGLDIETTARALGMSLSAVRVNRHRGLAKLRKVMEAESS